MGNAGHIPAWKTNQCTAYSRQTGTRCGAHAVPGRDVCRHHGGTKRGGALSPNYIHGKKSRELPEHLRERVEKALADKELHEFDNDLALLEARLEELLARVASGTSEHLWKEAASAFRIVARYRTDPTHEKAAEAFETLREIMDRKALDSAAWSEVRDVIEQRRRILESKSKRDERLNQYISATQAMVLMVRVTDLVKEYVKDHDALVAIASGLNQLASYESVPGSARLLPTSVATVEEGHRPGAVLEDLAADPVP